MESIGKLAGGIAHDFNNLLATVKVLTSLLRMSESSAPRLESLEQIEQAVDSGMKLTRGLLDFARREAPLAQRVSLNGVVRAVARLVERTLPRRIIVVFELNATRDDVLGEPSRLEQMVMNLVMNARDAMPDGGRLTLRTWDAGPRVGLEVVDTGVGIDPAIRDRIFEPYFTTKTHGAVKGTGLGLATVHGIVEAHRGSIEVAPSPAPGTVMRVLLPVAPADTPKAPEPVVRDRRLEHGKGLVLLVEDEPALSRASSRVLSGLGYDVLCAGDGVQALSLFREHQREVVAVVLDMILPRMDGQQTFAALKDVDPDVPVIITSGSTLDDTRRALLDSGVRDYLPKPYDAEELSRSLAKVARQAPRQV
jgi:CheY-like chemotaxis protein